MQTRFVLKPLAGLARLAHNTKKNCKCEKTSSITWKWLINQDRERHNHSVRGVFRAKSNIFDAFFFLKITNSILPLSILAKSSTIVVWFLNTAVDIGEWITMSHKAKQKMKYQMIFLLLLPLFFRSRLVARKDNKWAGGTPGLWLYFHKKPKWESLATYCITR